MVMRRKFSARHFFEDCTKHSVTIIQYIGELCRYLLAAPSTSYSRAHRVRLAMGNGLRPEIWADFQESFRIPEIFEAYGVSLK
jgi:acyl-CoA synthetase (AMP-forming)/AMP-acid ligase II